MEKTFRAGEQEARLADESAERSGGMLVGVASRFKPRWRELPSSGDVRVGLG